MNHSTIIMALSVEIRTITENRRAACLEKNLRSSAVHSLRNKFQCALIIAMAAMQGCVSSVKVTKNYTRWEPIGSDVHPVNMPMRREILLNQTDPQYIEIYVRQNCETRQIKRTVEQEVYGEEQETQDVGKEFGYAALSILTPVTLAATPFIIGHNIYTMSKAVDDEEYKNTTRETQIVIASNARNCSGVIPIVLRTKYGIFPLGYTSNGYLKVRLIDVVPQNILMHLIGEPVFVEVGNF